MGTVVHAEGDEVHDVTLVLLKDHVLHRDLVLIVAGRSNIQVRGVARL